MGVCDIALPSRGVLECHLLSGLQDPITFQSSQDCRSGKGVEGMIWKYMDWHWNLVQIHVFCSGWAGKGSYKALSINNNIEY
eukprot:1271719-Amphidinium_carterae.1